MREAKTGATARKILKTQKSALGWTLFLSNFLLLALFLPLLLTGFWGCSGTRLLTRGILLAFILHFRNYRSRRIFLQNGVN